VEPAPPRRTYSHVTCPALAHELAHIWLGASALSDAGPASSPSTDEELERLASGDRSSGGDFYLTQAARVGKRFAHALVVSTLEGRTLYTDPFRLLGVSNLATFRELGQSLGVA
jgi:hypothetical protein